MAIFLSILSRARARQTLLLCTAACTVFCVSARGQAGPQPPLRTVVDPNGNTITTDTSVPPQPSLPTGGPTLTPGDLQILRLRECDLAKVNTRCKLIVDRDEPIAPPPVQMYSGQTVTVIVKDSLFYERYFLDYSSGQATVAPDIAASIIQGFMSGLAKFTPFFAPNDKNGVAPESTSSCTSLTANDINLARGCAWNLAQQALPIYQRLELLVAPDARVAASPPQTVSLAAVVSSITGFLEAEAGFSGAVAAATKNSTTASAVQEQEIQKTMDTVAADLLGYQLRIVDIISPSFSNQEDDCRKWIPLSRREQDAISQNLILPPKCIVITSKRDDPSVYRKVVTRAVTYSLDVLNMVSYSQETTPDPTKKKALASVVVNFADRPTAGFLTGLPYTSYRWEASAGVFFSWLPNRSFSVVPVYTGLTVTDNTATQTILRPTVVPFAAANYRLSNDIGWSRWKSNLYATGGIGINPNTVSADYAAGLSLSWRTLLFSGLCHWGHDTALTQGFSPNESLGASFTGTLPTSTFWTHAAAIGISIRVPTLTGR